MVMAGMYVIEYKRRRRIGNCLVGYSVRRLWMGCDYRCRCLCPEGISAHTMQQTEQIRQDRVVWTDQVGEVTFKLAYMQIHKRKRID